MRLSDRFVRVFHWIAPVLLPLLVLFGRGFFGAPLGWMAAIGIFIAPVTTIGMYILPVLVVFDRDARAVRRTRVGYNTASYVMWAAFIVMMFTLEDGGDVGPYGSVLSTWGLLDSDTSMVIFTVAFFISFAAYLVAIVFAIRGIVDSRRSTRPVHPGPVQPGPGGISAR